jgi:histidyl-tRNA synthetase
LDIPFVENRRLVRGLDYYTRTAFEITHDGLGAQATIVGGGRYDLLVAQSGGGDVPAVGGAFGVERLLLALDAESVPLPVRPGPEFFLVLLDPSCEPALVRLLHRLRMAGCAACRSDGSRQVAKQLKAADRSGARRAVFIGGEEWERGEVLVKDLLGGGQTPLPQVDGDPLQALLGLVSGNGHP